MTLREIFFSLGYEVDKNSEKKAEASINKLKSTATKLLGAIGIGFSLANLNAIAEEFNGINNQVKYATKELGDQEAIQQQILEAANDTRVSYSQMAGVVSDLVQKDKSLFGSVDEAAEFATLTTKLFKSAGKSESEIATLQETLNKSFAKGIVDSSTLNSLLEKAPEAINVMTKSLGVTKDELISMAASGTLSASTLKTAFTSSADAINNEFDDLDFNISDALLNIRNKWGLWVDDMNSTLKLTQTIGNAMVKGFSKVMDVLNRVKTRLEWLSEKLGGMNNVLKLLVITAGALFLAFNLNKIISGIKAVTSAFGGSSAKALAFVAIIILIALLLEDIIKFMSGEDSLIGELFKKAGIDADEVREKILEVWNNIKTFLSDTWNAIKSKATEIFGKLKDWWAENGESVKESLTNAWRTIKTILLSVWNVIKTVAETVFGALFDFWSENGESIKKSFSEIWNGIKNLVVAIWNALKNRATTIFNNLKNFWDTWGDTIMNVFRIIWDTLTSLVEPFIAALKALISFLTSVFSGDWEGAWESIKEIASNIWEIITTVITGAWDAICVVWEKLSEIFGGIFEAAREAISEKVDDIKSTIVDGFNAAIDWIKALPAQAVQWGKDIIQGVIDGIKGVIGGIGDAASGIADKIKSFIGFSEPDEGPLSNFHTYMPDMIDLMTEGIENGKSQIVGALVSLTDAMFEIIKSGLDAIGEYSNDWGVSSSSGFIETLSAMPSLASRFMSILKSLIASLSGEFTGSWESSWQLVLNVVAAIWKLIVSILVASWDKIHSVWVNLPDVFGGIFGEANGVISEKVNDINSSIVTGFQAAIKWIKALPSQAVTWGKDIMQSLVDGIRSGMGKLESAMNAVANKIESYIGFSEPDVGPLSNFHTYMPDMIDLMTEGIAAGKSKVINAIETLASGMSVATRANSVNTDTLSKVGGGNVKTSNVTQNVEINNQFNGDQAGQKKSSEAMDKASGDATSEMARAIAFGK